MAHLIKAFKGGAEYLWCNFDQVHLTAIYAECSAIEDEIQRQIKTSSNVIDKSKMFTEGFSLDNLEDVPCTPEEEARFNKRFEEFKEKARKKRLEKRLAESSTPVNNKKLK